MPTSAATIAHIIDTLPDLNLTAKKMFGEAALYLDGTVVAFICDDTLFIKPTPSALAILPDAERSAYVRTHGADDPSLIAEVPPAYSTLMSSSGLPSTTIRSASQPARIRPSLSSCPRIFALLPVQCWITLSGWNPAS